LNELNSVVHITIFHVYVFIFFLSIHNDIRYIMYIINIMVDRCENIYGIETQDDWVGIKLHVDNLGPSGIGGTPSKFR